MYSLTNLIFNYLYGIVCICNKTRGYMYEKIFCVCVYLYLKEYFIFQFLQCLFNIPVPKAVNQRVEHGDH